MSAVLEIHQDDNVWVALKKIQTGEFIEVNGKSLTAREEIQIKHKIANEDIPEGGSVMMYGTTVGKALKEIKRGMKISTQNTVHSTSTLTKRKSTSEWNPPDVTQYKNSTFRGYLRSNGKVGSRNFWIFVPLVFCENRNLNLLQETLVEALGYKQGAFQKYNLEHLISAIRKGRTDLRDIDLPREQPSAISDRLFKNMDGIKFLTHEGGCGGTRQDAELLCKLLASYITHPNVAGASVVSLGCQNAQVKMVRDYVKNFDQGYDRPIYYFEQQESKSESDFIQNIIRSSLRGMQLANELSRTPASVTNLCLGLECGGSDGFSGISANPALGYCTDMIVALGGSAILGEFPELHGAEQDLINRCRTEEAADRFIRLMEDYHQRAKDDGSGFEANPSPGNIRDGLITDAIKSLGAAKKGGSSPVVDVLDYGEVAAKAGLHLLCTPGGDVESTTGLAGAGANVMVFTTGLGTPTGNIICPTIKMSTNNRLAQSMSDIIDINAGTVITGEDDLGSKGAELFELIVKTASGDYLTAAEKLGQDDFIPWKRGISL